MLSIVKEWIICQVVKWPNVYFNEAWALTFTPVYDFTGTTKKLPTIDETA